LQDATRDRAEAAGGDGVTRKGLASEVIHLALCLRLPGGVVGEGVRFEPRSPQVLGHHAVPRVGSRLHLHADDAAGGPPELGVVGAAHDLELANGLDGRGETRVVRRTRARQIVVGYAVKLVLVDAAAAGVDRVGVDRTGVKGSEVLRGAAVTAAVLDAGGKPDRGERIVRATGQVGDCAVGDYLAAAAAGDLEQRGNRRHRYRLGDVANFQREVDGCGPFRHSPSVCI
jgi:hypothetical protein